MYQFIWILFDLFLQVLLYSKFKAYSFLIRLAPTNLTLLAKQHFV